MGESHSSTVGDVLIRHWGVLNIALTKSLSSTSMDGLTGPAASTSGLRRPHSAHRECLGESKPPDARRMVGMAVQAGGGGLTLRICDSNGR